MGQKGGITGGGGGREDGEGEKGREVGEGEKG